MRIQSFTLLALAALPLGAATLEGKLSEFKEALAYGKTSLFVRARHETVDSDQFSTTAHANTLRFALGYETKPYHAFSLGVQFEGVASLDGNKQYNSGYNGKTTYPLVSDATENNELQQFYLKYAPTYVSGLSATIGRQDLNVENQRFIGAVGWRQDWQSFDAAQASWKPTQGPLKGCEFYYAFLDDVHRITPEGTVIGKVDMTGHAMTLAYTVCKELRAVAYGYVLDFDTIAGQTAFLNQSTETLGLRAAGSWKVSDPWSVNYAAEYAKQSDYADNPSDISASYSLAEFGAGYKSLTLKLGYEVLSSNLSKPNDKFTTPLATLHAFQGWADLFLTTPAGGIEDMYVWLAGPLPLAAAENIRVGAVFHDFAANDGSVHYGTELDLLAEYSVKVFDPKLIVGAKYASYMADDGKNVNFAGTTTDNTDIKKIWIYTQYSF